MKELYPTPDPSPMPQWDHPSDPEKFPPDVKKSPHTKEGLLGELRKKIVAYESTFETQANEIARKNMQLQQQSEEIGILQTEVKNLIKRLTAGPGSRVTQTHGEATMDVDTTGLLVIPWLGSYYGSFSYIDYLRGVEVIAGTTLHITSGPSFEWKGHGLKLHVPEGGVPPEGCRVDVKAGLGGEFEFPEGSHLVSGVYWLSCKETFQKRVTLEMQHCASDCSNLCFAVAKCSQPQLPYKFRIMNEGVFSQHTSYGSITVSQFSLFGIIKKWMQKPCPRQYCAQVYYLDRGINRWRLDFLITINLDLCLQVTHSCIHVFALLTVYLCIPHRP